ncbi:hypothetical protein ACWCPM_14015 [Streptomyces sp. NPDC002309]
MQPLLGRLEVLGRAATEYLRRLLPVLADEGVLSARTDKELPFILFAAVGRASALDDF